MHKLYIVTFFVAVIILSFLNVDFIGAISPNIVISQVQLGDAESASNEFITIYNDSDVDVDISNWCLYYASASSIQNGSKLTCFLVDDDSVHLFLPAHATVFSISNQLAASKPELMSDFRFSATLSGVAGHVRLNDSNGEVVDKIGWGATAVSAEGSLPTVASTVGSIINRKALIDGDLQDTDVNYDDFEVILSPLDHVYGLIYEERDLCSNIDDIQSELPDGYSVDDVGICSLPPPPPTDICANLDGLQAVLPDGYLLDDNSDCQVDTCLNIDELQQILPIGYRLDDDEGACLLDLLPMQITELLPNPSGVDSGNEFIEIHNPNDVAVDLSDYVLYVGEHEYPFSDDDVIGSGEYLAFFNGDIKFTLLNTSSFVKITSSDGYLIDEVSYTNPGVDMSWALVDGLWQYTDQITPDGPNLPILTKTEIVFAAVVESELQPCAANQYRSPDTNRCRLMPVEVVLAPCKDGQYRSEETNRCRNIASDVVALVPCAEGQERNPETNRCRSIVAVVLGDSDLVPCKEGQERNPETNRCRNIVSTIPVVDYAPIQTDEPSNNYIIWWSLAGVGVAAIIYGIWEWRQEIMNITRKLTAFRQSGK
jgi:hypothetical protein